jgi:hypothetical protein
MSEQQPGDTTNDREDEAFGQELSNDPRATRPQSRAHGELAIPRRRPREDQMRDVRARDEEHARDGAEKDHERQPHVADELFTKRNDCGTTSSVGLRVVGSRLLRDRVELRGGALDGDVFAQSTHGALEAPASRLRPTRIVEQRRVTRPELDIGSGE